MPLPLKILCAALLRLLPHPAARLAAISVLAAFPAHTAPDIASPVEAPRSWLVEALPAGGGCVAVHDLNPQQSIRLRLLLNGQVFLHAITPEWGPLIAGDSYALLTDFDGRITEEMGMAQPFAQIPGMMITLGEMPILNDIARNQSLRLYFGEAEVLTAPLIDISTAVAALRHCAFPPS